MATLVIEIDDDVLAKATEALARRDSDVRQIVRETLIKVADDEAAKERSAESFEQFLKRFQKYDTGGPYTRDELNER